MKEIKVLIIDDSPVVRGVLANTLGQDREIVVVGTARDPYQAVEMIKRFQPDLLTLDVEMPGMNGLEFLQKLMKAHPLPVIMVSSLTTTNSRVTLQALEAGAMDYIAKPVFSSIAARKRFKLELLQKVKAVRLVNRNRLKTRGNKGIREPAGELPAVLSGKSTYKNAREDLVIGIGASTGGVRAVKEVISGFPLASPGVIIIQHMPASFTGPFASMLNEVTHLEVKEAAEDDRIVPGRVMIVPGDRHLELISKHDKYYVKLNQRQKVNYQRPAIDVTFASLAREVGRKTIGVILTGMGRDGARGLKMIKNAGGYTLAQDRDSSVVYGMPAEAFRIGAVDEVLPLHKITAKIFELIQEEEDLV